MSLWTAFEIAEGTDGEVVGAFTADGVTFDSREVGPGDLFIALKGEATDGHRFVTKAFESGASGAIVSEAVDHPHVRVADTMAALNALGGAARARTAAKIVGVTGSVGKTGTKEALFAALDRAAPGEVHRSVKSYNNHTGVPLSLARMPAAARYGVFEMGMNHAGELTQLTTMVRPHVAIVTAIAPAHAAYFADEAAIADAKGEIFLGLEPGGVAIVPQDSPYRDRLLAAARPHAANVVTFGRGEGADVRVVEEIPLESGGTLLSVRLPRAELTFTLGQSGAHWVSNGLAVLAAVDALGGDIAAAALALSDMKGMAGRGERFTAEVEGGEILLIDESYNANPASMAATLKQLGREKGERRIAVLGEMRELGVQSPRYHADLAEPVLDAHIDAAILVGRDMAALAHRLHGQILLRHVADSAAALEALEDIIAPGDAVLVKGSNAIGLSGLVREVAAGRLGKGQDAMLYVIAEQLGFPGLLNLIRYISFRAGGAVATALIIGLLIGPKFIGWLRVRQGKGQPIRDDGPLTHLKKIGTPTMGGLMILTSVTIAMLLWMDLTNRFTWACLMVTLGFGLIGFLDDYDKVTKRSHKGISSRLRLALEFLIAGIASWIILDGGPHYLYVPFYNGPVIDLGPFYIFFAAFIITGFGNAVNLTDGLDGLATMPVVIASVAFLVITYLVGNVKFATYLGIPHVPGAGDVTILCSAIIGAGLAFLWFNAPPAAVFMGDTGSLALGGALGAIAVVAHHEIVLLIIGGLFVLETVSVILQVFFYKRTGKRIFKMAPIHHHFEQLGWSEPTVVIRFWIISFVLALAGLATLKLR